MASIQMHSILALARSIQRISILRPKTFLAHLSPVKMNEAKNRKLGWFGQQTVDSILSQDLNITTTTLFNHNHQYL